MLWRGVASLVLAMALSGVADRVVAAERQSAFDCSTGGLCRHADSGLPARVLMRPASVVRAAADRAAAVLRGNLRPFHPWFVFETRDLGVSPGGVAQGWYRVGVDKTTPVGWVSAVDAIPWSSALVVTYANPGVFGHERRAPVLMFDTLANLRRMTDAADPERYLGAITAAIEAGDQEVIDAHGVISMEPRRFVDFRHGFYLLPVLDYERLPLFDAEARMLKIAAAVPQTETDLGRGATTLRDAAIRDSILSRDTIRGTDAERLVVEVKFVVDMTASMQPYLDAISASLRQWTSLIEQSDLDAELRYGLVGYTDVSAQCGLCPFVETRDFFPGGAADANEVVDALRHSPWARASGGGDWSETMFEGVRSAIESRWSENALKFVVLIGDASSNAFGGPKNDALSAASVRALADAADVRVIALHAKPWEREWQSASASGEPPDARGAAASAIDPGADWEVAEAQFRQLSLNPGQRGASYVELAVDPNRPVEIRMTYARAVYRLAERFANALDAVRRGALADAEAISAGGQAGVERQVDSVASEAFASALISYLGSAAVRPRDLTFWALDVDPLDLYTPALEVRVLIEKRDLEGLIRRLEAILAAFARTREIDSDAFFAQLQAASAAASLDHDLSATDLRKAAAGDLVPGWLRGLPYRSQMLDLSRERFAEMSADERARIEQSLVLKLRAYRDLYNSDEWVALWPDADELDRVYPVLLRDLP